MKKLFIIRRVVGESMLPKFRPGRIIIAWTIGRIKLGDIVVLSHDGIEKVKRINQIEGDKLYVLGDNTTYSTDSRAFGWIDRTQILARVVWPR